jgi:asparagine synthase (glutamine-hydrolysing)
MCGITGVLNLADRPPVEAVDLRRMLGMIRHRGPDGFGIYRDPHVALGSARLSIIDLSGGDQPIGNENGSLWVVYNGEIFNYVELRPGLEARGHHFATHTDTEMIVHLYEEHGPGCLRFFNGQFALALWDASRRELFLARDRMGIRPLYYTIHDGRLIFGSEIKALLAYPGVRAALDPAALDQVFTYWSPLPSQSSFRGIYQIPPGHYALVRDGEIRVERYWGLDYTPPDGPQRPAVEYQDELESLLIDAARIRMRADVPVGAYLSGGLDSSLTTALVRNYTDSRLETFSIAFDDPDFDESVYQYRMADFLGTDHRVVRCSDADIGRVFPEVIWHTETPILRTAPAPLFLLSNLVHDHRFKVVVTGEGADEVLAGYDIFKEMAIRRFWARQPDSQIRPLLLRRLYPDIPNLNSAGGAYLAAFFKRGLADTASPYYSHAIRWANTQRIRRFLADGSGAPARTPEQDVPLPAGFDRWSPLAQAQYLEAILFLSEYLLSSQGDRPAMGHSVEGRYPFLDYRVVEFCNRLPPELKLRGLTEKWILKQIGKRYLPPEIWQRTKRPYRAPIQRSFFPDPPLDYVQELLSERALAESGLFNPAAVAQLARKAASGADLSETDEMALTGVLSAQLVHAHFVKSFAPGPAPEAEGIKVVERF